MLGLGDDRKICRDRQSRRLCKSRPHAARARYHGGLRSAQERECEGTGFRPHGGDALGRTRPHGSITILALRDAREWANDCTMSSAPPPVQTADAPPELNPRLDRAALTRE